MFILELQVLPVLRRSPEGSGAPMDFADDSYRDVNRIGLDSVITATLASCPVLVQTL